MLKVDKRSQRWKLKSPLGSHCNDPSERREWLGPRQWQWRWWEWSDSGNILKVEPKAWPKLSCPLINIIGPLFCFLGFFKSPLTIWSHSAERHLFTYNFHIYIQLPTHSILPLGYPVDITNSTCPNSTSWSSPWKCLTYSFSIWADGNLRVCWFDTPLHVRNLTNAEGRSTCISPEHSPVVMSQSH